MKHNNEEEKKGFHLFLLFYEFINQSLYQSFSFTISATKPKKSSTRICLKPNKANTF